MTPEFNWDQFEPVESEQQPADQQSGFDWSQFEAAEPETEKELPQPHKNIVEHFKREKVPQNLIDEYLAENSLNEFSSSKKTLKETPRGLLSGATFGLTSHIPGFKPEGYQGKAMEVAGSFLPINLLSKAASYPLIKLAEKSPILQNQLKSFANLVGISSAGGIYGGLEEATAGDDIKLPSVDTMLEHGAEWAALDLGLNALGWGGRFVKGLYQKAKQLGKPIEEAFEQIMRQAGTGDKAAETAISILEGKPIGEIEKEASRVRKVTPKNLEERNPLEEKVNQFAEEQKSLPSGTPKKENIGKAEQLKFDELTKNISEKSKPYLPAEFEAEKIAEEAIETDLTERIDSIGRRASSEKQLGENIQADITAQLDKEKKDIDSIYQTAKNVETSKSPKLQQTANSILENIKRIESGGIKLSPEGYKKALTDLKTTLEDLGYSITQDIKGLSDKIIKDRPISLDQAIEVKKRLNAIIDYDLLETSAQDFLKGPTASLRQDIRQGYGKNTKARKAFEEAERRFGEYSEKKARKSIKGIQYSQKPESIAKTIKTPSGLQDVKSIVSPEQFAQVEREVLEHIKSLPEEKASQYYREIRDQLNPNTRTVAEEILQSKIPKSSPARKAAQREKIKNSVLDEISKATITGERPDKALDLWKTTEGQQLIKNALEGNPHKQEVLKYLSDQSFNDFYSSVISKDGHINFKKFNEMLKDPATAANIKLVAGEDGLNFFKNLEQISERMDRKKALFEKQVYKSSAKEREAIEDAISKAGKERLARRKEQIAKPNKTEKLFNEKIFGDEAQKAIKEQEDSLRELGKDRIKRGREKRKELSTAEKALADIREKASIIYKMDNLLSSYGVKGKGVLAALGVWKIGTIEGLSIAAGYEIFKRLAKNKSLRKAITNAAGPRKDPTAFIYALESIDKASEED